MKVQRQRDKIALQQAEEKVHLAAARLAQILRLDPVIELRPHDSQLLPLSLISTAAPAGALVEQALAARPEAKENAALEARLRATQLSEQKVRDEIAQQVVTGRERVLSLAHQLATARLSLSDAKENLRLDQERKEFGVGIVLETIVAEQELTHARTDYLRIVADYNKVQYDLLRALGQISTDLSASRVTRSR